jgi:radical SAM superfamily enzyme YgiQ (UPF0313 family)
MAIPPLGLLYIASALRNRCKDYNIKIIDLMQQELNTDVFVRTLRDFSPDAIGFSSFPYEFNIFKKLSILAREILPESVLISGGLLATNYYSDLVRNKLADFAVLGEGELTINELFDALNNDRDPCLVKGIAYFKNGKVILTAPREFIKDLDEIPLPSWDLINLKSYSKIPNWNGILFKKYYAPILTSRGCVYNCIYCNPLFGKTFRARTPANVISEIEILYKDYDIREFHIIDDLFNFDSERVRNICKGILEKRLKIKISFPNGLRADRMDKETLKLLKDAGTYKINYAVESANPRVQTLIRKNLDLEKTKEIIEETSKLGIITFGFFMFGFPTETVDEMRETISFAVNSKLDTAKFLKVTAFHNTALSELAPGFVYGDDLRYNEEDVYYGESINYTNLPTPVLNNIVLEGMWKFYTNLGRVFRIVIKYHNITVIKKIFEIYFYVLIRKEADNNTQARF